MKKTDLRSMAYAFIANETNVYFPDNGQECFVVERLSCNKCNTHWHTALLECYFCGELNYYLYQCSECGKNYSLTNASKTCNCGNSNAKLVKACVNPKCPTNTNEKIKEIATNEKGVFDLEASLNLSLMYCIKCGSPYNYYNSFKIFIYNDLKEKNFQEYISRIKKDLVKNDFIVVKNHKNSVLKYDFIRIKTTQNLELPKKYKFESVENLIDEILSI